MKNRTTQQQKSKVTNLTNNKKEQLINRIAKMIVDGKSKSELIKLINRQYSIAETELNELINSAFNKIDNVSIQSPSIIIHSHIEIYEKIHSYFVEIGYTSGAKKAMKAKEKLLGVLKKDKLVINENSTTIINTEIEYDTSKLSPDEKKRMEFLLNKARIN